MKVLLVEDDAHQRERCASLISAQGHEIETAVDGQDGLEKAAIYNPDIIVTDLRMPRVDGFELLKSLRESGNLPPTIVLTAFGSVEMAISVVHDLGGFWFLEKPVDGKSLQLLLDRAASHGRLKNEVVELRRQLSFQGSIGEMVGQSASMQHIFALIRQVAPSNAPVLVTGESGTGKELVARGVHELSRRADKPFIAINCAALPEALVESELFGHEKGSFTGAVDRRIGCMEQANGGTLFLDELGEMPMPTQAKLLRVLEDYTLRRIGGKHDIKVDMRIIAATNRDPRQAIKEQKLREDLFYRLNVFHIELPPLRDRREDIDLIVATLVARLNPKHETRVAGFHADTLNLLRSQRWDGNIRELRNVIERSMIIAGEGLVQPHHIWLPNATAANPVLPVPATEAAKEHPTLDVRVGHTIDEAERTLIEATLDHTRQNKTRSAAMLGISAKTLHAKINQYRAEAATAESSSD
ncbi:sigma-54-dependent transcriptional regulator [Bryobacter aggregatus]|uniref:sigma-54-dependent transcriptional regulator n=1 Tax=Bryobacter aggregatus TaxID=360054 RepID=UPI0004E26302|nr:sigma-54 dependent transcriptional regulator [Bryobacter aggregatus]